MKLYKRFVRLYQIYTTYNQNILSQGQIRKLQRLARSTRWYLKGKSKPERFDEAMNHIAKIVFKILKPEGN